MTSVFLSYARDDVANARLIAVALEKAGHSVWWDRHIKGGAQYSKEIEAALKAAEAVVVLWSEHSIDSDWVRDEAAAGRDSGRLVPVMIDETEAPLGFRQYQTINLSRWRGRRRSAQFQEMLGAVETLGNDQRGESIAPAFKTTAPRLRFPLMLAVALAVILIAAMFVWQPWNTRSSTPIVTVLPSDGSPKSQAIAGNLLVQLGSLQATNANALQLVEPKSRAKPDLTFRAGAVGGTQEPRANLSLIDNHTGVLLWSREFVQPGGNQADLSQQIAYSAAQVLNCATEALTEKHQTLDQPTLKLYLSGCADLSNLLAQNPQIIISRFAKVTQQAPEFPGGWAKLLIAEVRAFRFTGDQALQRDLRNHITQARRAFPSMSETFLAEAWIQKPRPISGWMKFADLALANGPDNPAALTNHAGRLQNVGLMDEALAAARRAVEVDPLSPMAQDTLVQALLNTGQIEAARNEVERSERVWPGATSVLQSRFALEYRVGDPAQALLILQSGKLGLGFSPRAVDESFLKARMDPSIANVERAVADAHGLFRQDPSALWTYAGTLAQFNRQEELVDVLMKVDPRVSYNITWVLFRPVFHTLHKDKRFMAIARRFGLIDYWRYARKWADFCSRSDLPYDCKAEAAKLR